MLEDDGDGEDIQQFVLSMECVDANQILNSNATTYDNGNLKLLDEVKPQIGSSFKVRSTSNVYHNVEGQGHAKVQFEICEINNIKEVFYVFGVNENLLFIGKIINKGHLTIFSSSQHLIVS